MSVAKINLTELNAAKSASTFSDLSTDASESSSMQDIIENFVAGSKGKLKGEAWEAISGQLSQFSTALTERMNLANKLSSAIQEALDLLINYIGDEYTSLDCSDLPELEADKQRCQDNIDSIKGTISSISRNTSEEEESGGVAISYYYGLLNNYENELAELEKLIDKLKGLESVYDEAESILNEAYEEVSNMSSMITNISVGEVPTFIAG